MAYLTATESYIDDMRIVAIADTHTFEAEWTTPLPDGDILIYAGDALRAGTLIELEPVAQWLRSQPHKHKLLIAGNHDKCFQERRREACDLLGSEIHYLEDEPYMLDGVCFWGSPWTPQFHNWAFMLPRGQAIKEKWDAIPNGIDILITHGPPKGIGDGTGGYGHIGCEDLLRALEQVRPHLHLFGHCHSGGGVYKYDSTQCINVTTWECERGPTVIDFAPNTKQITIIDAPPGNLYS